MHSDKVPTGRIAWHHEFTDYGADSDGNIWSRRVKGIKFVRHVVSKSGHLHFAAWSDCPNKVWCHRFVLECFRGPCPEGMEARHLNGIPGDNRIANLEWNTRSINTIDRHFHSPPNRARKLTLGQIPEIRKRLKEGWSNASIGNDFGVTSTTIAQIKSGKIWWHVP